MFPSNFYSVTFLVINYDHFFPFLQSSSASPMVLTNSCPGRNNRKFITSEPLLNIHTSDAGKLCEMWNKPKSCVKWERIKWGKPTGLSEQLHFIPFCSLKVKSLFYPWPLAFLCWVNALEKQEFLRLLWSLLQVTEERIFSPVWGSSF